MDRLLSAIAAGVAIVYSTVALAAEPDAAAIRAAVSKAIPQLEAGSRGSAEKRKCFTCHSQALPVIALAAAKERGFAIDEENLQRQVKHTFDFLTEGKERYLQGKGQGGNVLTAGYALWTLSAAKKPADDVTAAVAKYIAGYQGDLEYWHHRGKRPPTAGSDFTATYVALRGLNVFGPADPAAKFEKASAWTTTTEPKETEDHVFRLRTLMLLKEADDKRAPAQQELLKLQRSDGGWSQKPDMESDAYATATVLVTLLEAGVPSDNEAIHRGVKYLLDSQKEDGTWHVKTRAVGFQEYYESGFPHDVDQFISISASSWATWALVLALPAETAAAESK